MNPALIYVFIAVATFLAGGIAGGRANFAKQLAATYLDDANDNRIPDEHNANFLLLARKAEITESRWDLLGTLMVLATALALILAIVAAVSQGLP